jgi:UDP-N-acetylenolpyruvoylglucosamine reductase
MEGGTSKDLAAGFSIGLCKAVHYHGEDARACFKALEAGLKPGDWVAVVGAGDIDQHARRWVFGRKWDRWVEMVQPQLSPATVLLREEPLAEKTTLRAGGAARAYAEPAGVEDLRLLLGAAKHADIRVFILGRGSNVLVPDEGVDGLVISFSNPAWSAFEPRGEGCIWAGAGLRLKNFCGLADKAGLKGFEFLEGIPGTVGGALRMNAGAMGGWIFDVVIKVQVMLPDGELRLIDKADMNAEYRGCAFLENAIALGALLGPFSKGESGEVGRQIEEYRLKRQESQPREPSAGCIFKNPPGESAGKLIDECWLKGERIGGAEVSAVHANFIINRDSATTSDVMALIRLVRTRVREIKGIELEPEVLLFGKDWKDVL